MDTLSLLATIKDKGVITELSFQFAKALASFESEDAPENAELALLIASLTSHEFESGNVCLDIFSVIRPYSVTLNSLSEIYDYTFPQITRKSILKLNCIRDVNSIARLNTPLVLSGDKVYLSKNWNHETIVAEAFSSPQISDFNETMSETLSNLFKRPYETIRGSVTSSDSPFETICDILNVVSPKKLDRQAIEKALKSEKQEDLSNLDELIPDSNRMDWQKVAVAVCLMNKVAIISGGPGTGKTTTVCKLLAALLIENARESTSPLSIKVVAPTGKAAGRLTESIAKTVKNLDISDAIKEQIPTESSTIHRLLGAIYGRSEYRFNKNNKLPIDVLVIDEASMVDLAMMSNIISALPHESKLILLGDKDQLSSVDAGSVLGDICSFHKAGYNKEFGHALSALTGYEFPKGGQKHNSVSNKLCILQKSYRFHAKSGIGTLAKYVNRGYFLKALDTFNKFPDVEFHELATDSYDQLIKRMSAEYTPYLEAANSSLPKESLSLFTKARLLCAVKEGSFGTEGCNRQIENELNKRGLINLSTGSNWYIGKPIMVIRNDYGLGLCNGDIGITMRSSDGSLKVYFEMPNGEIKGFLTSRIPEHDCAYSMTIHKSQGSEFELTTLILPPTKSQVATRELIYTGITRGKKKFALYSTKDSFINSVKTKTSRVSGLVDLLS